MSIFEPAVVKHLWKASLPAKDAKTLDAEWKKNVETRVATWKKKDSDNLASDAQLLFEAECVEYVTRIYNATTAHGNAKGSKAIPPKLPLSVPILGPRFRAPTYLEQYKRNGNAKVVPDVLDLVPITILHPFYLVNAGVDNCPQCGSTETSWRDGGWTGAGPRNVHGARVEERAVGYQLRCRNSLEDSSWCPNLFKPFCCYARTFDIIAELRLSSTAAGLAENIKQLHLLEMKQCTYEYLQHLKAAKPALFSKPVLEMREDSVVSISSDLITDLYELFSARARQAESSKYLRTLSAISVSTDATFKAPAKAKIVQKDGTRAQPLKGGIVSFLNEKNEIVGWRICMTQANTELQEMLAGLKRRCDLLRVAYPEMLIADNCCHVRGSVIKVIPSIKVAQDIWHLLMRMLLVILNGSRNPHRRNVAEDIVNALLKKRSQQGSGAEYWSREEQVRRFKDVYEKYAQLGEVWTAAADKVYSDQLAHVQKGCLSRTRNDVLSDGSRIEGSHKGWNSIQRSFSTGIENFLALSHDFVLRRNIRVIQKHGDGSRFGLSTNGCHHVGLVDAINRLFNELARTHVGPGNTELALLPTLADIASKEFFGLAPSELSLDTLIPFDDIKEEEPFDQLESLLGEDLSDVGTIAHQLEIDPVLLSQPRTATVTSVAQLPSMPAPTPIAPAPTPTPISSVQASASVDGSSSIVPQKRGAADLDGHDENSSISPSLMLMDITEPIAIRNAKRICLDKPPGEPLPSPSTTASAPAPGSSTAVPPIPSAGPIHPFFSKSGDANGNVARTTVIYHLCDYHFQLLLLRYTNIDARCLNITSNVQFYLFMDLRAKHQWSTFTMSPRKWTAATSTYNDALFALLSAKPKSEEYIAKVPKALMEKLSEVEGKILQRLSTNKFTSAKNTETFWRKHCFAVPLMKLDTGAKDEDPVASESLEGINTLKAKTPRKAPVCQRCMQLLNPGGKQSPLNHKRDYCSDGVCRKSKVDDMLPPWPQPAGVYINGSTFDAMAFLAAIRTLYTKTLNDNLRREDYELEDDALGSSLASRLTTDVQPNQSLFQMYRDFSLADNTAEDLVVIVEGTRYLRVDCLDDCSGATILTHPL
ncbi:hypothetical protein BDZ89DRAFT_1169035 [Hymenopellis radicata]|nr:hypothetical protein BDZ89DRAFT_1169035 [Hymenopellis radicata]